ncbi:MAG TPA: LLM class flavin-dependent oxidoreductase [Candidatus Binataceae bacterium]|nr:LLM class flavin-dependent oxidoreductase [Candidatus Binataceae bacterium]
MKLSIVDQSPVPEGFTPADALRNSIDLARLADRLGYERYWIAEHHATGSFASSAPEILIARVAAETAHIRVGSGGVMLPHYSPLKVAEVFRMLHALYPARIDLGIGRAPGGSPLDTFALRRDRNNRTMPDDFTQQMAELMAFLSASFPAEHPFREIQLSPAMPGGPEVWLLGSSMWSAAAAAQFGVPYAFAHFIDPTHTRAALKYYHAHVNRQGSAMAGRTVLALGAICAETEALAQRLYSSVRAWAQRLRQGGGRGAIPSPERALAQLGSSYERLPNDTGEWPRVLVGEPKRLHAELTRIAEELHIDEIMIVTVVYEHQARRRSYELLAEAFGLEPRTA